MPRWECQPSACTAALQGAEGELNNGKTDRDGKLSFDVELGAPRPWSSAQRGGSRRIIARRHPAFHVMFTIEPHEEHCHIELLLSAYVDTTSRGSL